MRFTIDLILVIVDFIRGGARAFLGRRRQRYTASTYIPASRQFVWNTIAALDITFPGAAPLRMQLDQRDGDPSVAEGTITASNQDYAIAIRSVSGRAPESCVLEILRDGTDPRLRPGEDYFVSVTLVDRPAGTWMTVVRELTHTRFSGRITIPLINRRHVRRVKALCETQAGVTQSWGDSHVGAAVVTGVLTYAGFHFLIGWQFAAVIVAIILIHELGHALAMRWVGQPVRGIYFVPFLGGVAVAGAPHRSEGERGLVALMGPGLSLISTAALVLAWQLTGDKFLGRFALMSAAVNGINLAPVLPLDGGHVTDALLSRFHHDVAAIVKLVTFILGIGVALYLGWWITAAVLCLAAPSIFFGGPGKRTITPITAEQQALLFLGYAATIAFYASVIIAVL